MKISKQRLKEIIKEELAELIQEGDWGGAAPWSEPEPERPPQEATPQNTAPPGTSPEDIGTDVDRPPNLSRKQWAALKKKLKHTGQTSWDVDPTDREEMYTPSQTLTQYEEPSSGPPATSAQDQLRRLLGLDPEFEKRRWSSKSRNEE
jgi:hypothetical protein